MAMNLMNPWWPVTLNFPSGDVDLGGWFSQNVQVSYAGVPGIERDVVQEVASFGRQLGVVSEAVLELAAGPPGEKTDRLRDLANRIEAVKDRHKNDVKRGAKEAIERLAKLDKEELRALLRRYKA